ncbi:SigE family RNA polymerase sigma factor [Nocardioides bizhenqiangii]|uniref:SigE family RNA polymerase sigma factor n=1 Tax=Nocardioides bizhenqiangii TaxID=3095076 RepID=A0ABZ0ZQP3_9ACTN|nr:MULTISPECIES: SigE family RNA polymerase sigma factor [unclassified Nocardioides]MDZ5619408.1 SigE family RNA polymerase sigma factor [Nocardioides sp. HM23]WQQ26572.1 SigE family RNA polymerase sigma factor [Nocardioides sp. HM61]
MRRSARDDAEFTEFVAARSDQLYRSAYLLTTSPHAAEDLLQTTLTKVYVGWRRLRAANDPVAYAHGILIKSFLSERRLRRSGELPVDRTPEPPAREPVDPVERLTLMAALAELAPLDRAAVVLRYWNDQSVAATAADLGLTEAAVKNRCLRGLRLLRDLLGDDAPDPTTSHPSSPNPVA